MAEAGGRPRFWQIRRRRRTAAARRITTCSPDFQTLQQAWAQVQTLFVYIPGKVPFLPTIDGIIDKITTKF